MEERKQQLMGLKKEELVELVLKLENSKGGRKGEVLDLIKAGGVSIDGIAGMLGINNKNVSSVLSGLRSDGYVFLSYKIAKENFIDYVGKRGDDGKIYNDDQYEVNERGVVIK